VYSFHFVPFRFVNVCSLFFGFFTPSKILYPHHHHHQNTHTHTHTHTHVGSIFFSFFLGGKKNFMCGQLKTRRPEYSSTSKHAISSLREERERERGRERREGKQASNLVANKQTT
jgi:hypothetical protein